jgi:hypothetical protein
MAYTPESGDLWINRTEKSLRFNLDNKNYSLCPSGAWFTAGETILYGQPVSMGTVEWQAAEPSIVPGRVYLTDSSRGTKTFGLSLSSSVVAGNEIEIQTQGLFEWPVAGPDIFPANSEGQIVYVDPEDGVLTIDRVAAALGSSALIEVGIVRDRKSMLIGPEGDGLGLNSAQLQFIAGEIITLGATPVLVAQSTTNGRVYLADKRKSVCKTKALTNAIGFIVPGSMPTINPGDSVLVQTSGAMGGFAGLTPGAAVVAGDDGAITQSTTGFNYLTDRWFYVGVASSATSILLRVGMVEGSTDINEIGAILPKGSTTADTGYLSCTGQTGLSTTANPEYTDLYARIGITYGGTGPTDFDLPDMSTFGTYGAQIRYSYAFSLPSDRTEAPIFRWDSGWITYPDSPANYTIDVPTVSFGTNVSMEDMVMIIYARERANPATTTRKIEAVVHDYFDVTHFKYGFEAVQNAAGNVRFTLAQDGLAYANGLSFVPLTSAWEIKALVFKSERWNRFYDYTADQKLAALWALGVASYTRANVNTPVSGMFHRGATVPVQHTSVLNFEGLLKPTRLTTAGDIIIGSTASSIATAAVLTTNGDVPGYLYPDSTNVQVGAVSGKTTIRNNLILGGSLTLNGTALITNDAETFTLLPLPTTMEFGAACTALTIGALTGTTTIRNAALVLLGDLAVNGGDITSSAATFNIAAVGTSTVINLGTALGTPKTINIAAANATDVVNFPSTLSNSVRVAGGVQIGGSSGLLLSVASINSANAAAFTLSSTGPMNIQTSNVVLNIGTSSQAKTITLSNTLDSVVIASLTDINTGTPTDVAALRVDGGVRIKKNLRVTNDVYATTFYGSAAGLTGVAGGLISESASKVVLADASAVDATHYLGFFSAATAAAPGLPVLTDAGLTFNPLTNTLTVGVFAGAGTGLTGLAPSLTAGKAVNSTNVCGQAGLMVAGGLVNCGSTSSMSSATNASTTASTASLVLREAQRGGSTFTPPRLAFLWSGRRASQVTITDGGSFQLLDEAGTNYVALYAGAINGSSFNATSLRVKKTDIEAYEARALDLVDKVQVVSFKFKEDENKVKHIGFIADDTPTELSGPNKDSMSINDCIGVLLKAVQELRSEIRDLRGNRK